MIIMNYAGYCTGSELLEVPRSRVQKVVQNKNLAVPQDYCGYQKFNCIEESRGTKLNTIHVQNTSETESSRRAFRQ